MKCKDVILTVEDAPTGARRVKISEHLLELLNQYIGYPPTFYILAEEQGYRTYIVFRSEEDITLYNLCLGGETLSVHPHTN